MKNISMWPWRCDWKRSGYGMMMRFGRSSSATAMVHIRPQSDVSSTQVMSCMCVEGSMHSLSPSAHSMFVCLFGCLVVLVCYVLLFFLRQPLVTLLLGDLHAP